MFLKSYHFIQELTLILLAQKFCLFFQFSKFTVSEANCFTILEFFECSVYLSNFHFYFIVYYRPPAGLLTNFLRELSAFLKKKLFLVTLIHVVLLKCMSNKSSWG